MRAALLTDPLVTRIDRASERARKVVGALPGADPDAGQRAFVRELRAELGDLCPPPGPIREHAVIRVRRNPLGHASGTGHELGRGHTSPVSYRATRPDPVQENIPLSHHGGCYPDPGDSYRRLFGAEPAPPSTARSRTRRAKHAGAKAAREVALARCIDAGPRKPSGRNARERKQHATILRERAFNAAWGR